MRDIRTPWCAKAIVVLTLAYIISPIDLIPDFIPVIGLLDEVILIPLAYKLVMKLIPDEVKADVVLANNNGPIHVGIKVLGIGTVMIIWFSLIYIIYQSL